MSFIYTTYTTTVVYKVVIIYKHVIVKSLKSLGNNHYIQIESQFLCHITKIEN